MKLSNSQCVVFAAAMMALFLAYGATDPDSVFSSDKAGVSFRYPANWSPRTPQLHTTLALLYADDGSEATCNLNASSHSELSSLSGAGLDAYRKANHTRQYFESTLAPHVRNLRILKYWRGFLGSADAGFIAYSQTIPVADQVIQLDAYMGVTFAGGKRFTLNCNAPSGRGAIAKKTFDYIRSTIQFMQ